ncbi:MAG: hypothetical protein IT562_10850 [Alphaproteobacteria bacterium]|nr:hypothetical protein [Alphaproteobacteria bacterium]
MPARVTIYDISDPEKPVALERFPVVASEIIASDPKRFVRELPAATEKKK